MGGYDILVSVKKVNMKNKTMKFLIVELLQRNIHLLALEVHNLALPTPPTSTILSLSKLKCDK